MLVMDCTLRDGANVVGKGFDARLTKMMIEGMIAAGITTIEMGNCLGLGAYEANGSIAPCTDEEYLQLMIDNGLQVYYPTDEQKQMFVDATADVEETVRGIVGDELVDAYIAAVEAAKAS